ncbi:NAD(P)-binding protein [Demequina sp. NBRC 110056]|uniref:NAD(P)-binding protein n=1 Tax=Demequina sp. NBRC 110056 TaxID=1570345 RepID=UPI000A02CC2D|nr:NAD(P)-binding protein [Demequina sp. NBRC 110056]
MTATIDTDYVVIGAGAAGMAFADALVAHSDATVTLADTRDAPGGHWHDAYPFVRLHQASPFYGVASTMLGGARQRGGPEDGLLERATGAEVLEYYATVLRDVLEPTGRVEFLPATRVEPDRTWVNVATGARGRIGPTTRIVDARLLSPTVPSTTPAPWEVDDGSRVVPVGDLASHDPAGPFVIVGSGKTATDGIVHLVSRGTDPSRITWVRPRDPWMLDRAHVQPDAAVFQAMTATVLEEAERAPDLDGLFAALERAGIMMRLDTSVTPTMAKAPTLGRWELELLRSVEDVVRLGRLRTSAPGLLRMTGGDVRIPREATVVHCAADGLRRPRRTPVWSRDAITLQTVRAGFPCFGAALIGYVEATRSSDDDKNLLCPPNAYGDSLADWALMTLRGADAVAGFMSEPDIAAWAHSTALNPARVTDPDAPGVAEARARASRALPGARRALAAFAGVSA